MCLSIIRPYTYNILQRSSVCPSLLVKYMSTCVHGRSQGRIQDFKLGGAHLKKNAPSRGRRENFWGISCEKSRFYAKKSYFSNFRGGRAKLLGYFMWKITILRQKIHIFTNFRGGRAGCAPPPPPPPSPESAPGSYK